MMGVPKFPLEKPSYDILVFMLNKQLFIIYHAEYRVGRY
jgi:hypothetical protein